MAPWGLPLSTYSMLGLDAKVMWAVFPVEGVSPCDSKTISLGGTRFR